MVRSLPVCVLCLLFAGCQPLALSVAGAGASATLGHSLNGVTYRTFTAPLPAVKTAALAALERMGITLEGLGSYDQGELIYAAALNRSIEIELETITPRATRMRVATRNGGFFYDSSTAAEIVTQTEKQLEARARADLH